MLRLRRNHILLTHTLVSSSSSPWQQQQQQQQAKRRQLATLGVTIVQSVGRYCILSADSSPCVWRSECHSAWPTRGQWTLTSDQSVDVKWTQRVAAADWVVRRWTTAVRRLLDESLLPHLTSSTSCGTSVSQQPQLHVYVVFLSTDVRGQVRGQ